ncbi:endo-1,4-beta-xylanase [soil metagenome]
MTGRSASQHPSRRLVATGGLALLSGCDAQPTAAAAPSAGPPPALREIAPFPVGTCVYVQQLDDTLVAPLIARQFSQVTPEWQMKMEVILKDDGTFDFGPADRIAAFARAHGQRLYCTTLVWFAQDPVAFKVLDGNPAAFAAGLRRYIQAVVGRYAGQAVGWDVVNETVEDDGSGIRKSMWSRNLGEIDHMLMAFALAHEADPRAVLFLNDYGLELLPKKRLAFLRLVETLLKRGCKLGGLGTQSHLSVDNTQPGACRQTLAELARFGLPIHVSELDVSLGRRKLDLRSPAEKLKLQTARAVEMAQAFHDLPPQQRFAFTMWGARDSDSWLKREPNAGDGTDAPLLFDVNGAPKPLFTAVSNALSRA